MSLKSTLLTGDLSPDSNDENMTNQLGNEEKEAKDEEERDDGKASELDIATHPVAQSAETKPPSADQNNEMAIERDLIEKSVSHNSSTSSISEHKPLDYKTTLRFYSQVGQLDRKHNEELPESALHVVLPDNGVSLGYSIGYKIDDSMDIVDGDVFLYRPPIYGSTQSALSICILLSMCCVGDFVLVLSVLFHPEITFNALNYDGGNNAFVVSYYVVLLISLIGCMVCVWCGYLRLLSIFYASFMTDLMASLLWLEHYVQFLHWMTIVLICYLLGKYISSAFGKWNFLQSQSRLDEIERIHLEGRF